MRIAALPRVSQTRFNLTPQRAQRRRLSPRGQGRFILDLQADLGRARLCRASSVRAAYSSSSTYKRIWEGETLSSLFGFAPLMAQLDLQADLGGRDSVEPLRFAPLIAQLDRVSPSQRAECLGSSTESRPPREPSASAARRSLALPESRVPRQLDGVSPCRGEK